MYRIVVCDDEKEILNYILQKVEAGFEQSVFSVNCMAVSDARELVALLQNEPVDIIFLDIDMPFFSGLDIAKMITEKGLKTLLVFVTSYDALVYQTFAYRPFAFIRKSFFQEEIGDIIKRLEQELLSWREELVLQKAQEIVRILVEDIYYIEASGNYIDIYTKNGIERYRMTLANMENELKGRSFLRCHKGYLVNIRHINRMKNNEIELTDGSKLPVGRNYEKEVRQAILMSMRSAKR